MNEISFTTDSSNYTVNVPPVVKSVDHYKFGPHTVDATFDFSKVPDYLHEMGLQMIQSDRKAMFIQYKATPAPVRTIKRKAKGWFEYLFGF